MERHPTNTIDDFTRLLVKSGLVTEARIQELLEQYRHVFLPTSKFPDTITPFCTFIVEIGDLTVWQCQKLRNGQWKGFFDIKGFEMIDGIGWDGQFGFYLARDLQDGSFVRIVVDPSSWSQEHGIQFRIEHRYE